MTKTNFSVVNNFITVELFLIFRFWKDTSSSLWKAVMSVSNQGAKKGRGKRRGASRTKDLNRGQEIGTGDQFFFM